MQSYPNEIILQGTIDKTDRANFSSFFFLFKAIKETALHLAVRLEEKSSLALVDFLCQNRSDPAQSVTSIIQLARKAAGTHHRLYVHITATVWRRERRKETQRFTTACCITSQSL